MTAVNVPLKRPMLPRDPHEPGRGATPLELLFDLVFVVAIASNSAQLHHAITEHHASAGILGYTMTWFAIWWAWVGFTWFASAYDNDDALYRLLAFVIMTGSLMLAASVPDLFADGQSLLAVAGYAVMRLGYVALWLRAAASDPVHRQAACGMPSGSRRSSRSGSPGSGRRRRSSSPRSSSSSSASSPSRSGPRAVTARPPGTATTSPSASRS